MQGHVAMSARARPQTQVGLTLKSMYFASTGSLGTPLARAKERRKPTRNKAKYCRRRAGRRRIRCLNLNTYAIQGRHFSFGLMDLLFQMDLVSLSPVHRMP